MLNQNAKLNNDLFAKEKVPMKATRDGYGEGMVLAGREDKNVVALCADLTDSTRVITFKKEFPDRFIEVGVAEQNMASIAAGMAVSGKVPFISTYAVFCPGRNWDQVRVNICYNNANVKLTGAHSGVSVGPDGATHQALEDIAITRCLPNMIVLAPCDALETRKATYAAAKIYGPVYLRFAREKTANFTTEETPFEIGKAEILWDSSFGCAISNLDVARPNMPQVAIIACGPLVYKSLIAAKELEEEGIHTIIINNHTIKPMDEKTVIEAAKKCGAVVTVEDHQIMGGMGSAVAEVLSKNYPVPQEFIGMPNSFGESGEPEELLEKYGMGVSHIKEAVKKVIKRKRSRF